MNDQVTAVAEAYRALARRAARGRSAEYESLAESVADVTAGVGFIASQPPDKRQPNLLFAAARYLLDVPPLDLNPLDVTSDDDVRWLSCLVWPGEGDRGPRLQAAIAAARRDPPAVHRGDLLTDLPALAARASAGATLVIGIAAWRLRP